MGNSEIIVRCVCCGEELPANLTCPQCGDLQHAFGRLKEAIRQRQEQRPVRSDQQLPPTDRE